MNNKLVNIIISTLYIIMICVLIISIIAWIKTNNLIFIISGSISILGALFNRYLYLKEKSKK